MRDSERNLFIGLLLLFGLGIIVLYVFQSVWLGGVQYLLKTSPTLPVSTTPAVFGPLFPTSPAPAQVGKEIVLKNTAITVTRVLSPADYYVANSALYSKLETNQEYLMVQVTVRCLSSATESCRVTELDFGVKNNSGGDYPAELSGNFSDRLKDLFEGGEIKPGKTLSGWLVFVVQKNGRGLTLYYPRLFGFGNEAQFTLKP